jgi:hypothetical protein
MNFEPRIVPQNARATDYGPGAKRFLIGGVGGSLPQAFVVAASAADAESWFRKLHGFAPGNLLERMRLRVTQLED